MLNAIDAVAATMTGMLKMSTVKGPGSKLSRNTMRSMIGAASAYVQCNTLTTGLAMPAYYNTPGSRSKHSQVITIKC